MKSAADESIKRRCGAHTQYRTADGTRVPGVTTITGVMDKPALVRWANLQGLAGVDTTKYVDETAKIGTLAHYLVECRLLEIEPDLSDATPNQLTAAQVCFQKWLKWEEGVGIKQTDFAMAEAVLVSEKHRFGGTIDIACVLNGKSTLIDVKTCKGIYGEHKTQVAGGYSILLEDAGFAVEQVIIVRIGREESEGFEQVNISDTEIRMHRKRFLLCRELYECNRMIDRK